MMAMLDLNELRLPDLFDHLAASGQVDRLLELARDEDLGPNWERDGDITTRIFVPSYLKGAAEVVFRKPGVVAGLACTDRLLHAFRADVDFKVLLPDGQRAQAGQPVLRLEGRLRDMITAERTLLNLIGRLSGVATRTAEFVAAAGSSRSRVLDTRKTTPGLRALEKYAVRCGGGFCHRLGLYDAVLLKDNHLAASSATGGKSLVDAVLAAVKMAKVEAPAAGLRFIELEVDSLAQLRDVLLAGGCGVDIVLLDNMDAAAIAEAVSLRDSSGVKMLLEASGGVTLESIGAIAATGVDRISTGSLTHGATWVDVGLDVKEG